MGILVYRDRRGAKDLVGKIDFARGASASFSYDAEYLRHARSNGELGISERIPLDEEPYSAEEIGPFFSGLLPEGEVFGNLAQMYQVPRSDYFSVLEQLGCESIGALTFVSEEIDATEYEPKYEGLSEGLIDALRADPVRAATSEASSTRLSLSGAQSKIAWFLPEGKDAFSAEVSEADIMSIALDMDISLEDWDDALRQIIRGITSFDSVHAYEDGEMASRILENAAPRIAILQRYCG